MQRDDLPPTCRTYGRNNRTSQNQKQRRPTSSNRVYERRNNQQRHNFNDNRERNAIRFNNNNIDNQSIPESSSTLSQPLTREESDIPGFSFDIITQKYYKILPNMPGQPKGSTRSDLNNLKRQHELNEKAWQFQLNFNSATTSRIIASYPCSSSLPFIISNRELGFLNPSLQLIKRCLEEQRLRCLHQNPSYKFDVIDNRSRVGEFAGCQFLDVQEGGKTLIGCWNAKYRSQSCIVSYKISVNSVEAQKNSSIRNREKTFLNRRGKCYLNTYGLRFEPVEGDIYVSSTLVDMLLAPADSDVTCILYATADSVISNNYRINTSCKVFLKPVDHLTKEEGKESMTSPIYNAEWSTKEPIWSCAFDSNQMRIGIGMEKCATIYDVLSEESFKVSSGSRNVIAQQYSKEGNLLYLGRRNANISFLDLRMSNNHKIGEFTDSNSTCFIYRLEKQLNFILTDNFDGTIKLWDVRAQKCILNFEGHKNRSHKVPCFVDDKERFIFAVGEDNIARGWSLNSGELLCSIVCPKSEAINSYFPRLVYSDCWGGLNGNSAILIAVNSEIYAHELLF